MDNRSSYGAPRSAPALGDGGTIPAGVELAVNRMSASFTVDGSGEIKRLTPLPRGIILTLYFTGNASLVNNTNLICPGGNNINLSPGDAVTIRSLGDGVWRVLNFMPAIPNAVARAILGAAAATAVYLDDYAIGDGATDDTANFLNALAAVPAGGKLKCGAKSYLLTGSGSEIATLSNPITIEGAGVAGTIFLLGSGIGTARDLFKITPGISGLNRGLRFKNFSVRPQSGSVGRHNLHFDTSGSTTGNIADVLIESVFFDGSASAGGNSIFINNGNGNNNGAGGAGGTGTVQGGTFNFTARDCTIFGAITVTYGGDSLRFVDNIVSGSGAVVITQVLNAGAFQWTGNNCSPAGGLTINQAVKPIIERNEFEQQAFSTQIGETLATSAATASGNTLHFASVPASIVPGLIARDLTTSSVIPAGTKVQSVTSTTVVLSNNVTGGGVASGDTIAFGGLVIDFVGNVGAVVSPVLRDNQVQCLVGVGNSTLVRFDNCVDAFFDGNLFAVPATYIPVAVTPNALRTNIGRGNTFPGLSQPYVQDGSVATAYPFCTEIMGQSGTQQTTASVAATYYASTTFMNPAESVVDMPFTRAGIIKNLNVYTLGAPGAGESYTFTLRDAFADTAISCAISGAASNSNQDVTHYAWVNAGDRWSLKVATTSGAPATNVAFSFEHHYF